MIQNFENLFYQELVKIERADKVFAVWEEIKAYYSHACLEHDNQTDNNDESTECNSQLCWDTEDKTELYSQSSIQKN